MINDSHKISHEAKTAKKGSGDVKFGYYRVPRNTQVCLAYHHHSSESITLIINMLSLVSLNNGAYSCCFSVNTNIHQGKGETQPSANPCLMTSVSSVKGRRSQFLLAKTVSYLIRLQKSKKVEVDGIMILKRLGSSCQTSLLQQQAHLVQGLLGTLRIHWKVLHAASEGEG